MKLPWSFLAARIEARLAVRRYRVAPRANPAAFRYDLLRGIQAELRRAGLATPQNQPSRPNC